MSARPHALPGGDALDEYDNIEASCRVLHERAEGCGEAPGLVLDAACVTTGTQAAVVALMHLRAELFRTRGTIRNLNVFAAKGGAGAASPRHAAPLGVAEAAPSRQKLRDLDDLLAKTPLTKAKLLGSFRNSRLDDAFHSVCKAAPLGEAAPSTPLDAPLTADFLSSPDAAHLATPASRAGGGADAASAPTPTVHATRNELLRVAASPEAEAKKRSKSALTALCVGCGHASLPDLLLALYCILALQENMYTAPANVNLKPAAHKLLEKWAALHAAAEPAAVPTPTPRASPRGEWPFAAGAAVPAPTPRASPRGEWPFAAGADALEDATGHFVFRKDAAPPIKTRPAARGGGGDARPAMPKLAGGTEVPSVKVFSYVACVLHDIHVAAAAGSGDAAAAYHAGQGHADALVYGVHVLRRQLALKTPGVEDVGAWAHHLVVVMQVLTANVHATRLALRQGGSAPASCVQPPPDLPLHVEGAGDPPQKGRRDGGARGSYARVVVDDLAGFAGEAADHIATMGLAKQHAKPLLRAAALLRSECVVWRYVHPRGDLLLQPLLATVQLLIPEASIAPAERAAIAAALVCAVALPRTRGAAPRDRDAPPEISITGAARDEVRSSPMTPPAHAAAPKLRSPPGLTLSPRARPKPLPGAAPAPAPSLADGLMQLRQCLLEAPLTEALLLAMWRSDRVHLDHYNRSAVYLSTASGPAPQLPTCHPLVLACLGVLEAQPVEFGFPPSPLLAALHVSPWAVQHFALALVRKYVELYVAMHGEEAAAAGNTDVRLATLTGVLAAVARCIARLPRPLQLDRPPFVFSALSVVLAAHLSILAPAEHLDDLAVGVLDRRGEAPAAGVDERTRARLVFASVTGCIVGSVVDNTARDLPAPSGGFALFRHGFGGGVLWTWAPRRDNLHGAEWVTVDGRPDLALERAIPTAFPADGDAVSSPRQGKPKQAGATAPPPAVMCICVTAPARVARGVVLRARKHGAWRELAPAREAPAGGKVCVIFTVSTRGSTDARGASRGPRFAVRVHAPALFTQLSEITVQCVALPDRMHAVAEGLLAAAWLGGAVAGGTLLLARLNLLPQEQAAAALLQTPLFRCGMEGSTLADEETASKESTSAVSSPTHSRCEAMQTPRGRGGHRGLKTLDIAIPNREIPVVASPIHRAYDAAAARRTPTNPLAQRSGTATPVSPRVDNDRDAAMRNLLGAATAARGDVREQAEPSTPPAVTTPLSVSLPGSALGESSQVHRTSAPRLRVFSDAAGEETPARGLLLGEGVDGLHGRAPSLRGRDVASFQLPGFRPRAARALQLPQRVLCSDAETEAFLRDLCQEDAGACGAAAGLHLAQLPALHLPAAYTSGTGVVDRALRLVVGAVLKHSHPSVAAAVLRHAAALAAAVALSPRAPPPDRSRVVEEPSPRGAKSARTRVSSISDLASDRSRPPASGGGCGGPESPVSAAALSRLQLLVDEGDEEEPEAAMKDAEVAAAVWACAARAGHWMLELRQAWHLHAPDELAAHVALRATVLLCARSAMQPSAGARRRSSLLSAFQGVAVTADDTHAFAHTFSPHHPAVRAKEAVCADDITSEGVLQFALPCLPHPEQPLGLDEGLEAGRTVPVVLQSAIRAAEGDVDALLSTMAGREARVPHCTAALAYSGQVLNGLCRCRTADDASSLHRLLRATFFHVLRRALAAQSMAGGPQDGVSHPLAGLEAAGYEEMSDLQRQLASLCVVAGEELRLLAQGMEGPAAAAAAAPPQPPRGAECDYAAAALEFLAVDLRPDDVAWLDAVDLFPTLAPLFCSSAGFAQPAAGAAPFPRMASGLTVAMAAPLRTSPRGANRPPSAAPAVGKGGWAGEQALLAAAEAVASSYLTKLLAMFEAPPRGVPQRRVFAGKLRRIVAGAYTALSTRIKVAMDQGHSQTALKLNAAPLPKGLATAVRWFAQIERCREMDRLARPVEHVSDGVLSAMLLVPDTAIADGAMLCAAQRLARVAEARAPFTTDHPRLIRKIIQRIGSLETSLFVKCGEQAPTGTHADAGMVIESFDRCVTSKCAEVATAAEAEVWHAVGSLPHTIDQIMELAATTEGTALCEVPGVDTVVEQVDFALGALILLAGRDAPFCAGERVDVLCGDPAHLNCCATEEVLARGGGVHKTLPVWQPAMVVATNLCDGVVTVQFDSPKLHGFESSSLQYPMDAVRARGDGRLLVTLMDKWPPATARALAETVQMYASTGRTRLAARPHHPLSRVAQYLVSKATKLLTRLVRAVRTPALAKHSVWPVVNAGDFLRALVAIASRPTSLFVPDAPHGWQPGRLPECTAFLRGAKLIRQPAFACGACGGGKICAFCAATCHAHHEGLVRVEDAVFVCKCHSETGRRGERARGGGGVAGEAGDRPEADEGHWCGYAPGGFSTAPPPTPGRATARAGLVYFRQLALLGGSGCGPPKPPRTPGTPRTPAAASSATSAFDAAAASTPRSSGVAAWAPTAFEAMMYTAPFDTGEAAAPPATATPTTASLKTKHSNLQRVASAKKKNKKKEKKDTKEGDEAAAVAAPVDAGAAGRCWHAAVLRGATLPPLEPSRRALRELAFHGYDEREAGLALQNARGDPVAALHRLRAGKAPAPSQAVGTIAAALEWDRADPVVYRWRVATLALSLKRFCGDVKIAAEFAKAHTNPPLEVSPVALRWLQLPDAVSTLTAAAMRDLEPAGMLAAGVLPQPTYPTPATSQCGAGDVVWVIYPRKPPVAGVLLQPLQPQPEVTSVRVCTGEGCGVWMVPRAMLFTPAPQLSDWECATEQHLPAAVAGAGADLIVTAARDLLLAAVLRCGESAGGVAEGGIAPADAPAVLEVPKHEKTRVELYAALSQAIVPAGDAFTPDAVLDPLQEAVLDAAHNIVLPGDEPLLEGFLLPRCLESMNGFDEHHQVEIVESVTAAEPHTTTGEIHFYRARVIVVLFKATASFLNHHVVFSLSPAFDRVAWSSKHGAHPRALSFPTDRLYYRISAVATHLQLPHCLAFHAFPLAQQLTFPRGNPGFVVTVAQHIACAARRRLVKPAVDEEDEAPTTPCTPRTPSTSNGSDAGGPSRRPRAVEQGLPVLQAAWDLCMTVATRPYAPFKAQALSVLAQLLPQIYGATPDPPNSVLLDLGVLRMDAQQWDRVRHIAQNGHRPANGKSAHTELPQEFYRLVELVSLARRFTRTDLCSSVLLAEGLHGAIWEAQSMLWRANGTSMCGACAFRSVLNGDAVEPELAFPAKPTHRCTTVAAAEYEWATEADFRQAVKHAHAHPEADPNDPPPAVVEDPWTRWILGSVWDGALLMPYLKTWQPCTLDYFNNATFVDQLAITRRYVDYMARENSYLPEWMVYDIAHEAAKKMEYIRMAGYEENAARGVLSIDSARNQPVYLSFDARSATGRSERVLLSRKRPGLGEFASVGGSDIGQTCLVATDSQYHYTYQTVDALCWHHVKCAQCQKDIVGVRHHCTTCQESYCAPCSMVYKHDPTHLWLLIKRPATGVPEVLRSLYSPQYAASPAFKSKLHHGVACSKCSKCPIMGTRYMCSNCGNYNLCEQCYQVTEHPWGHCFLKVVHPVQYPEARVPGLPMASIYSSNPAAEGRPHSSFGWLLRAEHSGLRRGEGADRKAALFTNIVSAMNAWTFARDVDFTQHIETEVVPEVDTLEGSCLLYLGTPSIGDLPQARTSMLRFRFVLLRMVNRKLETMLRYIDPSQEAPFGACGLETLLSTRELEAALGSPRDRVPSSPEARLEGYRRRSSTGIGGYDTGGAHHDAAWEFYPSQNLTRTSTWVEGYGATFTALSLPTVVRRIRPLIFQHVKQHVWSGSMWEASLPGLPQLALRLHRMSVRNVENGGRRSPNATAGSLHTLAVSASHTAASESLEAMFNRTGSEAADDDSASRHAAVVSVASRRGSTLGTEPPRPEMLRQAFEQLATVAPSLLRSRPPGQPWKVIFIGEASDDCGGPFRESLTELCQELTAPHLGLFYPVRNAASEVGGNRDKWMCASLATSSHHARVLQLLGMLMGVAVRSDSVVPLDLPPLIWKQLVREPVLVEDYSAIDEIAMRTLANVDVLGVDSWHTCTLSGDAVPLLGHRSDVADPDAAGAAELYADVLSRFRLNEGAWQVHHMREGLEAVLPARFTALLSWQELQSAVCGEPDLDVERLRSSTVYTGFNHAMCPEITWFWDVLAGFTSKQQSLFLKFVWGRSRLGADLEGKCMEIKRMAALDPDSRLPTSHTCFFCLELPQYTTRDVLEAKLLYAVTHCNIIDTDYTARAVAGRDAAR